MIKIKVPATTANMGPGFDSIGMALELYNYVSFEEIESGLEITAVNKNANFIPTDEKNLIYKTMKEFYRQADIKMPGFRITQDDNIPFTRGLGSSATCIVSGLMAANAFAKTKLSKKEIAEMAAKMEGHPDNSTPAIYGGLVVSVMDEGKLNFVKIDVPERLQFNVMIPKFHLSTEKARTVVPKTVDIKDAVFNLSRTALFVSSVMSGNFDNLSVAMDDRLHQPYRMNFIHDMENIFYKAKCFGAKASFLSGAGPTLISITVDNNKFESEMNNYLSKLENKWSLSLMKADENGAEIIKI